MAVIKATNTVMCCVVVVFASATSCSRDRGSSWVLMDGAGSSDTVWESEAKLDTPGGDSTTTATSNGSIRTRGESCKKIDFLFAIDNSGSMKSIQQKLIMSFEPFIDAIVTNVDAQDYHVMVVDSDGGGQGCEHALGAGQVRHCEVPNPPRFLTSAAQVPRIRSAFECVANVGTMGSSLEMTFTAVEEAVTTHNASHGCNPGFLRHDAVLVVVIITDDHAGWFGEDNAQNVGTPRQWYETILAAKAYVPSHVVVLGFIPTRNGPDDCLDRWRDGDSDRFVEFMQLWGDQGITASVCEPDFGPFFQQAVELIDATCDAYVAPVE